MKKLRGFAALAANDPDRHHEIASRGGKQAHANGKAHEFTSEEARAAGQKGGQTTSQDIEHMARIGQLGGRRSHGQ